MDETPESFVYRCLQLDIANAHGWEVLNPAAFAARWNGGTGLDAITLQFDDETRPTCAPSRCSVTAS